MIVTPKRRKSQVPDTQLGRSVLLLMGLLWISVIYQRGISVALLAAFHEATASIQPTKALMEEESELEERSADRSLSTTSKGLIFVDHVNKGKTSKSPRVCPCCGAEVTKFIQPPLYNRAEAQCPVCKSMERHRTACAFLGSQKKLFDVKEGKQPTNVFRLLHFGPFRPMGDALDKVSGLDQLWLDFNLGMYNRDPATTKTLFGDASNLQFPDNFGHGAMIFHVLEHVPDLSRAIGELHRVLKPSGWLMVEVPIREQDEVIKDCRNLPDDAARIQCAGQKDHVWSFSEMGFHKALEKVFGSSACRSIHDILGESLTDKQLSAFQLLTNGKKVPQFFCQKGAKTTKDIDIRTS